ncbi:MAG: hypothetical protein SVU88_02115 [Candidatus Nanohaloarchaea archaeon]|nr:hypothetical protein [Candidatus Nanohaloarchaea archaeon]
MSLVVEYEDRDDLQPDYDTRPLEAIGLDTFPATSREQRVTEADFIDRYNRKLWRNLRQYSYEDGDIIVTPETELETIARTYMDEELWDRNGRLRKAVSTTPTAVGGGTALYAGSQALSTGDAVMGALALAGTVAAAVTAPRTVSMVAFEGMRGVVRVLETVPTEDAPGRRMVALDEDEYAVFEEIEMVDGEAEAVVDTLLEA